MRYSLCLLVILLNYAVSPTVSAKNTLPNQDATRITKIESVSKEQSNQITELKNQNEQLTKKISDQQSAYQTEVTNLKTQITALANQQKQSQDDMVNLANQQKKLQADTATVSQSVTKLNDTTESKANQLANQINNRTVAFILGLLTLLGLLGYIFYALKKRYQQASQTLSQQVETALTNVKNSEAAIVKSDTELADKLLEVVNELKQQPQIEPQQILNTTSVSTQEVDHTLAMKLADEIHRMRKRIEALPQETKGLKSLSKSLERLEEELNEQGYEMVDYLGSDYSENMSVNAKFIGSDELDNGQSVITKVVSPQVNYQGKMIRMADVEVSVG